MHLFDLTRPMSPTTPVYPGDPAVEFSRHSDYGEHGYRVTQIRLGTHAGTHLDAPCHFLAGGTTVDRLPLEGLVGPARVRDAGAPVGRIREGERILVRSGWGARWGDPAYFREFPGLAAELVDELAAAPAALLGVETPSLHPDAAEDARIHRRLLERGVILVENLAGLELLPEAVFLVVLPLPLVGLDGSPCRVVAWEE